MPSRARQRTKPLTNHTRVDRARENLSRLLLQQESRIKRGKLPSPRLTKAIRITALRARLVEQAPVVRSVWRREGDGDVITLTKVTGDRVSGRDENGRTRTMNRNTLLNCWGCIAQPIRVNVLRALVERRGLRETARALGIRKCHRYSNAQLRKQIREAKAAKAEANAYAGTE